MMKFGIFQSWKLLDSHSESKKRKRGQCSQEKDIQNRERIMTELKQVRFKFLGKIDLNFE